MSFTIYAELDNFRKKGQSGDFSALRPNNTQFPAPNYTSNGNNTDSTISSVNPFFNQPQSSHFIHTNNAIETEQLLSFDNDGGTKVPPHVAQTPDFPFHSMSMETNTTTNDGNAVPEKPSNNNAIAKDEIKEEEPTNVNPTSPTRNTKHRRDQKGDANIIQFLITTWCSLIDIVDTRIISNINKNWCLRSTEESYLTGESRYRLPEWYIKTRQFVKWFLLQSLFILSLVGLTYYVAPWMAYHILTEPTYRGTTVYNIQFVRNDEMATRFISEYQKMDQETASVILDDDGGGGGGGGGGPSKIPLDGDASRNRDTIDIFNNDLDNNGLDDDDEARAMDHISKNLARRKDERLDKIRRDSIEIDAMLNGRDNSKYNKGPSSTSYDSVTDTTTTDSPTYYSPAPRVHIQPHFVCGTMTQYEYSEHVLLRKKGCYDMIRFMIDMIINPEWLTQLLIRRIQESNSNENHNKMNNNPKNANGKYAKSKMVIESSLAKDEMMRMELRSRGFRYESTHMHCVCNTHVGIAEPFVYMSYNGREPLMIIDPKLEPLTGEQLNRNRGKGPLPIAVFEYTNMSNGLHDADHLLWQKLKFSPQIRQPRDIRVTYKTLPVESVLTEYYGPLFGPSDVAYLAAYANRTQLRRFYENGRREDKSLHVTAIASVINWLAHYLEDWREPLSNEYDAYQDVVKIRLEKQHLQTQEQRKRFSSDKGSGDGSGAAATTTTTENLIHAFTSLTGVDIAYNKNMKIPTLVVKENEEFSGSQTGCILHCMGLNEAMKLRRQQWRNYLVGDQKSAKQLYGDTLNHIAFDFDD